MMIQPDLLGRIRLLVEAYRIPVTANPDPVKSLAPIGPVRTIEAEVEARLPDGRFRVAAAGQRADVALPAATRVGDRVALDPAALRAEPAHAAPQTAAQLSAAGRLVAQLSDKLPPNGAAATVPAARPLLPDAPIDTAVAAATLRELIALSGLFYESHQAEWVASARDGATLMREPQGRLSPALAAPPDAEAQPPRELPPAGAAGRPVPDAAPPLRIPPDTAPLVQQQLNALESHHLVWSGQIWPGQSMDWEIREFTEQDRGGESEPERVWRTRLALDLPNLGRVTATIAFGGAGLTIRLVADSAATDGLFAERLGELRTALAAAELPVSAIVRVPHAGI